MPRAYSNPERENETYALPDLELFELNACEVAERDEDLIYEYMRRHEYRLAGMNSKTREKMLDAMIEEHGITGGWFYWAMCLRFLQRQAGFDRALTARCQSLGVRCVWSDCVTVRHTAGETIPLPIMP